MFANLKAGATVFVLDTREIPKYYSAIVKDVSKPYFLQQRPGQFNPMPTQQYVNLTLDGQEPWTVPINSDVAVKDGITVSMTRDGIASAVASARQESLNVVNSYEKHKQALEYYEEITRDLDPSYAVSKAQEERIQQLERIIAEQNARMQQLPTLDEIRNLFPKVETSTKTK